MSFLLSENRENDFHDYWKRYEDYLKAEGYRMPPGALKLAQSADWYDFGVHACPHDARLIEACLLNETSDERRGNAVLTLNIRLRGAYDDGTIHLKYPRVFRHEISSQDCSFWMSEWRYDEFRLSADGHLLHEIEWADGARWLIEASDIEFEWRPFEVEIESK